MEKSYTPSSFEEKIYKYWIENNIFVADNKSKKEPFTIMMPPPNITGQLHMGHALNNTLQDIIARYNRMSDKEVLWMPGTDHASIATECKIVEKLKTENKTKESIGREEFLKYAYAWKDEYGNKITSQLRRLGTSCDWSREAFTMDDNCSSAVKEFFIKLYNDGLIYRGDRITNWCTDCNTALSDAEVEHKENKGHLWHIKYDFEDGCGSVVVATTRPETMLGDVAVAVNPSDIRYKHLIGKNLILPIVQKNIPLIADNYVDQKFGTGAVKVTPAHDPNDFAIGERHNLESITIMSSKGIILVSPYEGLNRFECRKKIIEDLEKLGHLIKVEEYENSVGHCYRCRSTIEPMISKQWFVKMEPLAKLALDASKKGQVKFLPSQYEKTYLHWMNNIKDWCISRQLWWGHQIPVYYCQKCNHMHANLKKPNACEKCGFDNLSQDESVLDTWFSSALWPSSTLGYPNNTDDFKKFYPSNVLVTAYDIIFFWVARMIFSGLYNTKKVPFPKVLIHGIVRDEQGRKMSKTLGNGIDPIEIIEKYGADSLRMSLVQGISSGSDMRYSPEKLTSCQNFMNKVWNAAKYVLNGIDNISIMDGDDILEDVKKLTTVDKWILTKLSVVTTKVQKAINKYDLGLVSKLIYDFIWDDFCDWFIEMSKPRLYSTDKHTREIVANVLLYVYGSILKLLHPIAPFITEEIYQNMPNKTAKFLALEKYPNKIKEYKTAINDVDLLINIIKGVRAIRVDIGCPQNKKTDLYILPKDKYKKLFKECSDILSKMCMATEIHFDIPNVDSRKFVNELCTIYVPVDKLDLVELENKNKKELEQAVAELKRAENKLKNDGFISKAPKELIDIEKSKVEKYKQIISRLSE